MFKNILMAAALATFAFGLPSASFADGCCKSHKDCKAACCKDGKCDKAKCKECCKKAAGKCCGGACCK